MSFFRVFFFWAFFFGVLGFGFFFVVSTLKKQPEKMYVEEACVASGTPKFYQMIERGEASSFVFFFLLQVTTMHPSTATLPP